MDKQQTTNATIDLETQRNLIDRNPFLGVTGHTPRPIHDGSPFGRGGEERLKRDQALWDFAQAWDADNAARREARIAAVNSRREKTQAQLAAESDAQFVASLRSRYLASDPGATQHQFEADLPELRRAHRLAATLGQPSREARLAELAKRAGY